MLFTALLIITGLGLVYQGVKTGQYNLITTGAMLLLISMVSGTAAILEWLEKIEADLDTQLDAEIPLGHWENQWDQETYR